MTSQTASLVRSSAIESTAATAGPRAFEIEFGTVFDERFPELFRFLNRLVGESAMASDIAQQTFVKLYERGSMPDNVRGWLVSVACNLVRDEQRRVRRQRRLLLSKSPETTMADAPPAALHEVIREERKLAVRRALAALPERDRLLLLLRHDGYSYKELAAAVGIVETSVGTMLARASDAFRRAVDAGALGAGGHADDE